MEEQIVLVNEKGETIGVAPKLASHHEHTPLHRGFSCYVFNAKGEFLLTQRALVKKVWPSVWTNSVCGHPAPGEPNEAAVQRRLAYELGINSPTQLKCIAPDYHYTTPAYNGIIENEICPVFVAVTDEQPQPNPLEVENYRWIAWDEVSQLITEQPESVSFWFKDQYSKLFTDNQQFNSFLDSIHER